MRPRKIIFLVNPVSGTGGKEKLISRIERICRANNIHSEIEFSNAAADYVQLREKIVRDKSDVVAICGGDGTVGKAIGALYDLPVTFGIIPAGSGNGLALSAGIPVNIEKAVTLVCNGMAKPTDAFIFNGHFGCLACGLGFDASVAHDFASKKIRGLKMYLLLTTKTLFKSAAIRFKLKTETGQSDTSAFFISILNGNQYGNHIKVAPRADLADGKLDIVVAEKMNKVAFIFHMLRQLLSAKLDKQTLGTSTKKRIRYFQTGSLQIINEEMALMHIDGEPLPPEPIVEIDVIKNAFKLIRPE